MGGGIFNKGTLTMNEGAVIKNCSAEKGAGVHNDGNTWITFTMNGGSITNNVAVQNGGGVQNSQNATFKLNGGSITGNNAKNSYGGGVFTKGTMTLGTSKITITGNTTGEAKTEKSNLAIAEDATTVDIESALNTQTSIGVSGIKKVEGTYQYTAKAGVSNSSATDAGYFTSDTTYKLEYNGTSQKLELVDKYTATLTFTMSDVEWTGNPVSAPTVTAKDFKNTAISGLTYDFTWYEGEVEAEDLGSATPLGSAPTEVGLYTVVASVKADNADYKGTSEPVTFKINPVMIDEGNSPLSSAVYDKAQDGAFILRSPANFWNFRGVYYIFNGGAKTTVPSGSYTVRSGSIVVELTEAFMKSLPSGTYTFGIISGINKSYVQGNEYTWNNPDTYTWMTYKSGNVVEFEAIQTVTLSDGCTYNASFKEGNNQTLILGGTTLDGSYDIIKVSGGYQIKKGDRYISFDGKNVTTSDSTYTWKYDGGLYAEVKTTTTSGFWFWRTTKTTTTKYYLNANLTTGTKSVKAEVKAVGTHDVKYVNDGETHSVVCKNCGKTLESGVAHQYNPETGKCDCGKINPANSHVDSVKVSEKKTTQSSGFWFWRSTKTKYQYSIATTQTNVSVKEVKYSTDNKSWKSGSSFSSDLKLSELYIKVKDSNGNETNWKWDGTNTVKLVGQPE